MDFLFPFLPVLRGCVLVSEVVKMVECSSGGADDGNHGRGRLRRWCWHSRRMIDKYWDAHTP
jgi:hypothetical protein